MKWNSLDIEFFNNTHFVTLPNNNHTHSQLENNIIRIECNMITSKIKIIINITEKEKALYKCDVCIDEIKIFSLLQNENFYIIKYKNDTQPLLSDGDYYSDQTFVDDGNVGFFIHFRSKVIIINLNIIMNDYIDLEKKNFKITILNQNCGFQIGSKIIHKQNYTLINLEAFLVVQKIYIESNYKELNISEITVIIIRYQLT